MLVVIVLLSIFGGSLAGLFVHLGMRGTLGPMWPFFTGDDYKKPQIDYKKINELELELGLGHSDYGPKGLDLAKVVEEQADETDKLIETIDETLHPEKKLARRVRNVFSVPSHNIGTFQPIDALYPKRFVFPDGDTTYHGDHGLSCPCEDCYGEMQRRAVYLDDSTSPASGLVGELRKTAYVGGRPLPDPLRKVKV